MPRKSFRVGRSITGLGLFAVRPIKKGERIVEYRGPRVSAEEAGRLERRGNRYLYEINADVTIDGSPRSNIARYANHACNPNAETYTYGGRVFIRALRNINPDEEITYDYGNDYLKYVIGRSNCRCRRCRRRRARKQREARAAKKRRAIRLGRLRRTSR
ncbi:MAG TPA: SET domain-containing protein [Pseudolabrys sp.]|jgi:SET domain-containing protein